MPESVVPSPRKAEQAAVPPPGSCDLLDVPLGAGLLALARADRLNRPTGAAWRRSGGGPDDRLLLPLPPGGAAELPGLLCWLGWAHLAGELRGHEAGRPPLGPVRLLRAGVTPWPGPTERLVDACADACARLSLLRAEPAVGLLRAEAQPWAFS